MSADVSLTMTGSGEVGEVFTGWSVSEGSNSVNPNVSPNGSGAVNLTAASTPTSAFIADNAATFTHSELGEVEGIVTSVNDASVARFTVSSLLSLLQADRSVPPTGEQPLSEIISWYVALVTDQLSVDYQASSDPIKVYQGWSGEVWFYLNQLCSINSLEILLQGNVVVVRDMGVNELKLDDAASLTRAPNTQATGRNVEITYQNPVLISSLGTVKYNYATNPSVETNATDWSASIYFPSYLWDFAGPGTVTSSGRSTASSLVGAASFRARLTEAVYSDPFSPGSHLHSGAVLISHTFNVASIADGEIVGVSMGGRSPATPAGVTMNDRRGDFQVIWLDASNAVISLSTTTITPTSAWSTYSISTSKPLGAVSAIVRVAAAFSYYKSTATALTNQDFYADAVMFTNGAIIPYADGSSAGWAWNGATNNSTSQTTIPVENDFYNAYNDNNTIYSVNAGEITKTVIQTKNYPTYLAQPTQTAIFPNVVGTYYVSAADNLPVVPAEWAAYGGKVEVAIGEIPGTIELTLTGPTTDIPGVPGPYSLSVSDGENSYAALSVAGIGVVTSPTLLILGTGADPDKTTVETAASFNSPFIDTLNQAYTSGAWMQIDAAGPTVGLTGSVGTHQLDAFGDTAGSVTVYKNSIYRHTSIMVNATSTNLTANSYVRAGDLDDAWSGMTAGDFDALWSGYSAGDIHIEPLRTE